MRNLPVLLLMAAAGLLAQAQDPPFVLPESVEIKTDLVYARYGKRELRLDLYLPKSGAGPFPGVVYIHGGAWRGGNKKAFSRQAAYMAAKGFVGACIEYRLSGEAILPAAVHDAKAAVRWLRANAAAYRVNAARIGAAGGSAGGHLVALLGTTYGIDAGEGEGGNPGVSSRVQAVAAFNPVVDFAVLGKQGGPAVEPITQFLGVSYAQDPDLWSLASPITHVGKDSAPTLFLHGTKDATVPYQQSVDMMNKLKAAGVHAELFTAEGAAHGFFNRPPWYEPTLQRMEEFFTRTLR
jgi:acetyl esterase/lipase